MFNYSLKANHCNRQHYVRLFVSKHHAISTLKRLLWRRARTGASCALQRTQAEMMWEEEGSRSALSAQVARRWARAWHRLKLIAANARVETINHGLGLSRDRHALDKGSSPRAEHTACD